MAYIWLSQDLEASFRALNQKSDSGDLVPDLSFSLTFEPSDRTKEVPPLVPDKSVR